jgi:hypothetical protein
MMKESQTIESIEAVPVHGVKVLGWQLWVPYAAVAWSLIYAGLGIYWALGGGGFPYASGAAPSSMSPLAGRFGPVLAWTLVLLVGLPAAALGIAMLRGVRGRLVRPVFVTAGGLLAGMLLLLMTGLDLLVMLGYVPYILVDLFKGAEVAQRYWSGLSQWTTINQGLCLIGGFLWLAATVVYSRLSTEACLYCGRREDWQAGIHPDRARRLGWIAVGVAMVTPLFYAFTRFAWALGFPLGMTREYWVHGQETGMWIGGLFLAIFGLVGSLLMFGLVQRWGEIFPRWIPGLGGKRVPVGLALVPAALVTVLLVVGGIGIWTSLPQMSAELAAGGMPAGEVLREIFFQVGPTLLFPLWGAALAVAALAYYSRRRGPCKMCGRGELLQLTQKYPTSVV